MYMSENKKQTKYFGNTACVKKRWKKGDPKDKEEAGEEIVTGIPGENWKWPY